MVTLRHKVILTVFHKDGRAVGEQHKRLTSLSATQSRLHRALAPSQSQSREAAQVVSYKKLVTMFTVLVL